MPFFLIIEIMKTFQATPKLPLAHSLNGPDHGTQLIVDDERFLRPLLCQGQQSSSRADGPKSRLGIQTHLESYPHSQWHRGAALDKLRINFSSTVGSRHLATTYIPSNASREKGRPLRTCRIEFLAYGAFVMNEQQDQDQIISAETITKPPVPEKFARVLGNVIAQPLLVFAQAFKVLVGFLETLKGALQLLGILGVALMIVMAIIILIGVFSSWPANLLSCFYCVVALMGFIFCPVVFIGLVSGVIDITRRPTPSMEPVPIHEVVTLSNFLDSIDRFDLKTQADIARLEPQLTIVRASLDGATHARSQQALGVLGQEVNKLLNDLSSLLGQPASGLVQSGILLRFLAMRPMDAREKLDRLKKILAQAAQSERR
jgi:hypothetical protein